MKAEAVKCMKVEEARLIGQHSLRMALSLLEEQQSVKNEEFNLLKKRTVTSKNYPSILHGQERRRLVLASITKRISDYAQKLISNCENEAKKTTESNQVKTKQLPKQSRDSGTQRILETRWLSPRNL